MALATVVQTIRLSRCGLGDRESMTAQKTHADQESRYVSQPVQRTGSWLTRAVHAIPAFLAELSTGR